jgi:phosphatidylglycerophosphatase A
VGIAVVVGLAQLRLNRPASIAVLGAASLILFALGVWAAGIAESYFGRVDPGQVVMDEVVGQMLTFLLLPHATWKWLLGGFLLFRAFDIVKPFPARQAERFPRGWGIMVDDVVAGVYGLAVLAVIGLVTR